MLCTLYRPTATISWSKNSQALTANGHFSISQSGRVLSIGGVTTADAGSYTCNTRQDASQGPFITTAIGQLSVIGE